MFQICAAILAYTHSTSTLGFNVKTCSFQPDEHGVSYGSDLMIPDGWNHLGTSGRRQALRFQTPIENDSFIVDNMGNFGNMHQERGLTCTSAVSV